MKDPAVLFYFQDFLVGTEFMTDEEVGKYIRILCHQADKGALTLSQLKRICSGNVPEVIMEKLLQDDEGKYYQERMRAEKEKRVKHCEYQKERANKRWVKDECRGNAGAMPDEAVPLEDVNINEDIVTLLWNRWKKYKKDEFNFRYKSEVSENAAKAELLNLCGGDTLLAEKIIEQSIANGWKGLFNLKTNGTIKKDNGATPDEIAAIVAGKFASDRA